MAGIWRQIQAAAMLLSVAATAGACVFDSLVRADDSSFSHGPSRYGALHNPARLPTEGRGFRIPLRWSDRGLNYGVDEVVGMLVHVGRTLALRDPALVLAVGDISRPSGGRSPWHRSHQTGRDLDLLFFVRDHSDKRVRSEAMLHHDKEGSEIDAPVATKAHRFDVSANWYLVHALLTNPIAEVQYIFIQDDLRQLLLEYAGMSGVKHSVIARASHVLMQPGDSAPHDDHMHVRIYCPKSDLRYGCVDFGNMRWQKRDYKYESRIERLPGYENLLPEGTVSFLPWLWR